MLGYVDTKARSRGTWQWLIVANQAGRAVFGIHTWTEGYLTPVYVSLLKQLEAAGYACQSVTKPPDKFFVNLWRLGASLGKARAVLLGLGTVFALVALVFKVLERW
ncbi:hypothetical protein FACS1894116_14580 [Betaproteobacteria bacterium]|nr:hypothetical protein FACS1894116_14580 [Betaproteobacteria bacterium]